MAGATDARIGYWTDYSRRWIDGPQILVDDFWSRFMTSVVAVSLTLVSPYMFKILKSFFLWACSSRNLSRPEHDHADESTPLLNGEVMNHNNGSGEANPPGEDSVSNDGVGEDGALVPYQGESHERPHSHTERSSANGQVTPNTQEQENDDSLLDILEYSENSRDFVWRCMRYVWRGDKSHIGVIVLIILVLFCVFVAWTIVGIFSATIASDKTGLSSSQYCGIWQFDDNAGDEAAYRDDLYNRQKEERASQYARNCYNNPDPTDTLSCKVFYNQSISFETKTQQTCPFSSSELCFNGLYSAISLDTGLVDASVIGINSNPTFKFRRRTSCSPLNMSEPYISKHDEETNNSMYYYNYGSSDDTDYTFNTSGDPFEWPVPVYSANAEFSSLYPSQDYWHPIPGLKQPAGNTLTIFFVSSMHIFHISPSYDPVFPAERRRPFKGSYEDYFYNSDPRARPMACVETSQVCSADGEKCWGMRDIVPPDMFSDPSFWLMKWSLESSTIYDSMAWRLGAALLAQEKVSQFISTPLPPNQWEIEASQLFATSLARIQYDAWKIATGEDRERPGYVEVTPDEGRGKLCGLYKFKSADYTNVNLAAFIGFIVLSITIYILSWDVPANEETGTSKTLIIGALLTGSRSLMKAFGVRIYDAYKSSIQTLQRCGSGRGDSHTTLSQDGDTLSPNFDNS